MFFANAIYSLLREYIRWEAVFPGTCVPVLTFEANAHFLSLFFESTKCYHSPRPGVRRVGIEGQDVLKATHVAWEYSFNSEDASSQL